MQVLNWRYCIVVKMLVCKLLKLLNYAKNANYAVGVEEG